MNEVNPVKTNFFRLDGLLLFPIITGYAARVASSAVKASLKQSKRRSYELNDLMKSNLTCAVSVCAEQSTRLYQSWMICAFSVRAEQSMILKGNQNFRQSYLTCAFSDRAEQNATSHSYLTCEFSVRAELSARLELNLA